ncbi:hypothetical protein BGZ76_006402, partial [Entomortierella beljakovae]
MADGNSSSHGPVVEESPILLSIDKNHDEVFLKITNIQSYPIILGIDWLELHNPAIHWRKHMVTFQDNFCIKNYIEQYPDLTLGNLVVSCLDYALSDE